MLTKFLKYSFSTTRAMSGMENNSTAFVGCDNGHVSILTIIIGHCTVLARKLFTVGQRFSKQTKHSSHCLWVRRISNELIEIILPSRFYVTLVTNH